MLRGACRSNPAARRARQGDVSVMTSGCARWRVRSCPHVPFQWALRLRVPRNDEMLLTFSGVDDN
jgi:hypothetical protein